MTGLLLVSVCSIGPVKLEVVIDDILAVKVDAIVNGLNSNCELQGKIIFYWLSCTMTVSA